LLAQDLYLLWSTGNSTRSLYTLTRRSNPERGGERRDNVGERVSKRAKCFVWVHKYREER
jgi:hypothetical protein